MGLKYARVRLFQRRGRINPINAGKRLYAPVTEFRQDLAFYDFFDVCHNNSSQTIIPALFPRKTTKNPAVILSFLHKRGMRQRMPGMP